MTSPAQPIRVAIIDSGVNPAHPHVQPIAGGIHITPDGADDAFMDFLGHGTAVAGAIREKSPHLEIYAVKIFDRALATSGGVLLRALDWCLDQHMNFINLSLGTLNRSYLPELEQRIMRSQELGIRIVSAHEMKSERAFPGSLPGVTGVLLDPECPREQYLQIQKDGCIVYAASGYPRAIPGVPPRHNLQGISFAVANVTGFLAANVPACVPR